MILDLADRGVGEGLAGVDAAAGQFPPVVAGLVGILGVEEQDSVGLVEQPDQMQIAVPRNASKRPDEPDIAAGR